MSHLDIQERFGRKAYYLNEEMLNIIGQEFEASKIVEAFKSDKNPAIFKNWGNKAAKRTVELGTDPKYTDRTYEVMVETFKKKGILKFPNIIQRFFEILYMATNPQEEYQHLKCLENNSMALRYQLKKGQCAIYEKLIEICGENVASQLPCKKYCLEVAETILKDNDITNYKVTQKLEMPKDGVCQFDIVKS
ncbi:MAG: hypothetical protein ACFFDN_08640 [Candidatus Hodarchaeota archaeon]